MAASRAKQSMNKTIVQKQQLERETVELIKATNFEKARVRAEQTLQKQHLETAFDVLETMLDLLATRIKIIANASTLPTDLYPCVSSICYCVDRVDNPELQVVWSQLCSKFGKKVMNQMKENVHDKVHPAV